MTTESELVVEDGTGLSDADAFVDEEFVDQYCLDRDINDWFDGLGDSKAAIRVATSFLSNSYTWKGSKTFGRVQAQAFPRTGVTDEDGDDVDPSSVPQEVQSATCELAAYARANPGALTPSVVTAERVKREKIGPLETEFFVSAASVYDQRPILLHVEDMISGLIEGSAVSSLFGTVART